MSQAGNYNGGGSSEADVVGPASSTDNAAVRFDGTTGKLLQNSGVIIDDSNNVTGIASLTATNLTGILGATTQNNAQFYNPINTQTGTTYTLTAADCGKYITLSNASAITLTLPQQSSVTTTAGFWCIVRNIGAGTVTIQKQGSETLTGNTTITTNSEVRIERNTTTNWSVFAGTATVNMMGVHTLIQTVSNNTITLVGYAGSPGTLLGVYQKARSIGTAGTFNIQINGSNVTSLTSLVPSTAGSYTAATGANTIARGDQITIVYSGTTSVVDHGISLDFTQQF